jgi:hypothetical protein
MWTQFILTNGHFALNVFAALVFFSVFWLHFDAWLARKDKKEFIKILGFLCLSISFLLHATNMESTTLDMQLNLQAVPLTTTILGSLGYAFVAFALLLQPLMPKPVVSESEVAAALPLFIKPVVLQPILALIVAVLYLRRATKGLENHLKRVSYSFFLLTLYEFTGLAVLFKGTNDIRIYKLVNAFGSLWLVEHVILFIALIVLAKWSFGYLFKRIQSQLFFIFVTSILTIFLLTTVSFTGLLLQNLQSQALAKLSEEVRVVAYAIDIRKSEALSDAKVIAQDSEIKLALADKDRTKLVEKAENFLLTKRESTLVILDENSQVLARGEDKERFGESMSEDALVKRVIIGGVTSSIITRDGVLAPEVHVRAAVPVMGENGNLGMIVTGTILDDAFMSGIEKSTGLTAAIYGNDTLSATSLLDMSVGGISLIGIKESNEAVKRQVVAAGLPFTGSTSLLNMPYFASYLPLKDINNVPVGMLFVGKPQLTLIQSASRSIELTFIVTAFLIIMSIVPAYFISRSISRQLR